MGKDAKPYVSRSNDIQLRNLKEVSKLADDLTPEE